MPKAGKTKVASKMTKLIHPQSRKANKLGAREMRKERVKKTHLDTSLKRSVIMDKLLWFQEALDPDKPNYSKADAEELVESYLDRFAEELEQISIVNSFKSRSGRQHATREDIIHTTMKREQELFTTCGIEIPDVVDGRNLKLFRAWDGSPRLSSTIKLRKIVRTAGAPETDTMNADAERVGMDRRGDGGEEGRTDGANEGEDDIEDYVDDDDDDEDELDDELLESDAEDT